MSLLLPAVAAFLEGCGSPDDVARAYYRDPTARRVVEAVCRQQHVEAQAEDIHQEVGVRFVTNILYKVKEAEAAYGVLKATARNICGDLLRYHQVRPEYSLDELIEKTSIDGTADGLHLPGLADEQNSAVSSEVASNIDHQRAVKMFNERLLHQKAPKPGANVFPSENWLLLEGAGLNSPPRAVISVPTPSPAGTSRKRRPSMLDAVPRQTNTAADELLDIRNALGIGNEHFAQLLGVTHPMLNFYLYNARKSVPARVMQEARNIKATLGEQHMQVVKELETISMDQLTIKWMGMLGINPEDDSSSVQLATALEVSRATVWRWRNGHMKPKMAVLVTKHMQILDVAQKRKKQRKN